MAHYSWDTMQQLMTVRKKRDETGSKLPVPKSHVQLAAPLGSQPLPLKRGESCVCFLKVTYGMGTEFKGLIFCSLNVLLLLSLLR